MTFCIRGHYNLKRLKIADQTATNRSLVLICTYMICFSEFSMRLHLSEFRTILSWRKVDEMWKSCLRRQNFLDKNFDKILIVLFFFTYYYRQFAVNVLSFDVTPTIVIQRDLVNILLTSSNSILFYSKRIPSVLT